MFKAAKASAVSLVSLVAHPTTFCEKRSMRTGQSCSAVRQKGHIAHPDRVTGLGLEVLVLHVLSGGRTGVGLRGPYPVPVRPTDELLLFHQPRDALAARLNALDSKLGVNPEAAIDAAPTLVGLPNVLRKNLIFLTTLRLRALAPGVVA